MESTHPCPGPKPCTLFESLVKRTLERKPEHLENGALWPLWSGKPEALTADNQQPRPEGWKAWRDFEAYLLPNPSFSADSVMQKQRLLECGCSQLWSGWDLPHPGTDVGVKKITKLLCYQGNRQTEDTVNCPFKVPGERIWIAYVRQTWLRALGSKQTFKVLAVGYAETHCNGGLGEMWK